MSGKTSTSILLEFCAQQKISPPTYDTVSWESDPNVPIFTISVTVLNYSAKGSGRSKSEAKHAASQNMIDQLAQTEAYKYKINTSLSPTQNQPKDLNASMALQNNDAVGALITRCQQLNLQYPDFQLVSSSSENATKNFIVQCSSGQHQCCGSGLTKREAKQMAAQIMMKLTESHEAVDVMNSDCSSISSADTALSKLSLQNRDAVGALINICQQRSLKLPNFELVSVIGEDHKKQFTFACNLGNLQRLGTGFTKKEAKQKAACSMIQLIQENGESEETANEISSLSGCGEVPWVVPLQELPSVEEVLAEYRRVKHHVEPVKDGLRHRQNFFLKLPKKSRLKAQNVLMNNHLGLISAKEIVDQTMQTLNLDYQVNSKALVSNYKVFTLMQCTFDCVIFAKSDELFEKVLGYLKTMLNVHMAGHTPLTV